MTAAPQLSPEKKPEVQAAWEWGSLLHSVRRQYLPQPQGPGATVVRTASGAIAKPVDQGEVVVFLRRRSWEDYLLVACHG